MTYFRFQALPKEIRLMVYERIPVRTRTSRVSPADEEYEIDTSGDYFIVDGFVSRSILATCRQIHDEALVILDKKILEVLEAPTKITTSLEELYRLTYVLALLKSLDASYSEESQDSYESYEKDFPMAPLSGVADAKQVLMKFCHKAARKMRYNHQVRRAPLLVDIALLPIPGKELASYMVHAREFADMNRGDHLYVDLRLRLVQHMFPQDQKEIKERARAEGLIQEPDTAANKPRSIEEGPVRVYMAHDVDLQEWQDDWTDGERYTSMAS
ncbi:hypothetical protein BDV95DRAFT_608210 [Massariosphaeria phaeospora]|uniref:Uncharacterized protein n=1 Tax=Massariosphaeria phaeospora TaxID=100035 RepID=A0A7C8MLZ8_9PLEO|nr:hypothetical protein BDV95DRAFT_608210 [Massariosphaeria phaeospora]